MLNGYKKAAEYIVYGTFIQNVGNGKTDQSIHRDKERKRIQGKIGQSVIDMHLIRIMMNY